MGVWDRAPLEPRPGNILSSHREGPAAPTGPSQVSFPVLSVNLHAIGTLSLWVSSLPVLKDDKDAIFTAADKASQAAT